MFNDKLFKKNFLLSLGITLTGTIILGSMIGFLGRRISGAISTMAVKKTEILNRQAAIKNLSLLRKDAQSASRFINILQNALPHRDSLINFPQEINTISQKTGINLNFSFGQENPIGSNGIGSIAFQIVINGSLNNVISFFKKIEESRYIIEISGINLIKNAADYRGDINGRVYFQ